MHSNSKLNLKYICSVLYLAILAMFKQQLVGKPIKDEFQSLLFPESKLLEVTKDKSFETLILSVKAWITSSLTLL